MKKGTGSEPIGVMGGLSALADAQVPAPLFYNVSADSTGLDRSGTGYGRFAVGEVGKTLGQP